MPSKYIPRPKTKVIKCVSCSNTITVGIKTRKPWRCIQCGIKVMIENQTQMRNRSGPYYEKWRARMTEYLVALTGSTPPPAEENSPSSPDR